jgi:hypothetical protein
MRANEVSEDRPEYVTWPGRMVPESEVGMAMDSLQAEANAHVRKAIAETPSVPWYTEGTPPKDTGNWGPVDFGTPTTANLKTLNEYLQSLEARIAALEAIVTTEPILTDEERGLPFEDKFPQQFPSTPEEVSNA